LDSVDELGVVLQFPDDFAELEIPNYYLGVFTGTGDEPIAFTDVDISDVIGVSVERCLQS